MSSGVSRDTLHEAAREVLHGNRRKRSKFLEPEALQIGLKNCDLSRTDASWAPSGMSPPPPRVLRVCPGGPAAL